MADTLRAACLGVALAGLTVSAGAAMAQTVVIGNSRPSVTVDLGVLDTLGPAPTLPALLRGRSPQRISLTPPAPDTRPAPSSRPAAAAKGEPAKPAAAGAPQPVAPRPAPVASAAPAPTPAPSPPPPAAAPPPSTAAASPTPQAPPPPPRVAAAPPPAAAPVTPTPPAAASAAAPPPTQTASRPPAALPPTAPTGAGPRLVFGAGSSELPPGAEATLKDMSQRLNADESLRLQVVAYADGTPEQASQARRLSLSRALTVRSYLISQGVRSTRIDVRALGSRASDGPPDRVDLLIGDR